MRVVMTKFIGLVCGCCFLNKKKWDGFRNGVWECRWVQSADTPVGFFPWRKYFSCI
jgi:hypothetical protein